MTSIRSFFRSKIRGNERLMWLIPILDFALILIISFVPMGRPVQALPDLPIQVEQALGAYRQAAAQGAPQGLISFSGKTDVLRHGNEAVPVLASYLNDAANVAGAVDLLGSIGSEDARQTLLALLDRKEAAVPKNLPAALIRAGQGNPDFIQELAQRYQNGKGARDATIMQALKGIGPAGRKWVRQLTVTPR